MNLKLRGSALLLAGVLAWPAFAQSDDAPPPSEPPKPTEQAPVEPPAEAVPTPAAPKKSIFAITEPKLHRWGGLTISGDVWSPKSIQQDYEIAIFQDGINTRVMQMPSDTEARGHVLVLYHLPKDKGAIRFEYDSMSDQVDFELLTPGQFVYGELLTHPLFAGLNDDGLADGIRANASTRTREFRVEYQNTAFETPHAKGTYHVGLRSVDHFRQFEAGYFALLPNFPPFLPPIYDATFNPLPLFPNPDYGKTKSDFSANGLGGGLDVEFPLHKRVSILGSFGLGILHGGIDAAYVAQTWRYKIVTQTGVFDLTFADVQDLIASGPQTVVQGIFQDLFAPTVQIANQSRLAYSLEVSIAAKLKIWRTLEAYVGYRNLAYIDVGADVRFDTPVVLPNGVINYQTIKTENRSAGYHGYQLGLSYRF